jgi:hypothetical protein
VLTGEEIGLGRWALEVVSAGNPFVFLSEQLTKGMVWARLGRAGAAGS